MEYVINQITDWLSEKLIASKQKGWVVGVSGGVDSAVVSTLCAKTNLPTIVASMPIHNSIKQQRLANDHILWLIERHSNVANFVVDLTEPFECFKKKLPAKAVSELSMVNTMSRLRMIALYAFAGSNQFLVAGTGNKVEDYGIGFFTKYGDGGVDLSPIGDLKKTEVYSVAKTLGISEGIQEADPNDGLWEDGRSDEEQIGATYKELEWAMKFCDSVNIQTWEEYLELEEVFSIPAERRKVLEIYLSMHGKNSHKMEMPPVCRVKREEVRK